MPRYLQVNKNQIKNVIKKIKVFLKNLLHFPDGSVNIYFERAGTLVHVRSETADFSEFLRKEDFQ